MRIECWRKILRENYDFWFANKSEEPFVLLCRYLHVPVTSSLEQAAEKNPYAPLWAAILRNWGFYGEKDIERFYELEEFAGISPDCFNDVYGGEVLFAETISAELKNRWEMLDHYVNWALTVTSEEKLARRGLWALATRPWTEELEEELSLVEYLSEYDWYLSPKEKKLSPLVKNHLLGTNLQWNGSHWAMEHLQTMQELANIQALCEERKAREEPNCYMMSAPKRDDEDKADLSRTIRLIAAYDAMLRGGTVCEKDYPQPTMLGRDMQVLRKVEPTISYRPKDGKYKILDNKRKYAENTDITPLTDRSRKVRLLCYMRFLHDCGLLNREDAEKITGKRVPRRTFARDLHILRRAFPKRELIYHAKEKCYVWKEGVNSEN